MKNNKGITLIALVITIIVLLILAGVAIVMLSGDNGILTRATDAKVANDIGTAKDKIGIAAIEALNDYYQDVYVTSGTTKTYSKADLVNSIKTAISEVKIDEEVSSDLSLKAVDSGKPGTAAFDPENDNQFAIASSAKPEIYSIGTVGSNGAITWNDNFKASTTVGD